LNIPSFSGGAGDVWGNCRSSIGLENLQKQRVSKEFEPMKINDGKIEFVSFNSILGLGNERYR
jgi:diacylglycerol kinase (ATP)